jgi:hypothetical protein
VGFAEHDHMIEAFAPYRSNHSFRKRILPRAVGSDNDFLNIHGPQLLPKEKPVDAITIANKESR